MRPNRFVIYRRYSPTGISRWYWRMVAPNGKIIADSAESYVSRANVMRAVRSVVSKTWEIEVKEG